MPRRRGRTWLAGAAHRGLSQAAAIFTDPPYNVPVNGHVTGKGRRKHREFAMAAGEMTGEAFTSRSPEREACANKRCGESFAAGRARGTMVRPRAISPRPCLLTSPTSSRTYPDRLEDGGTADRKFEMAISSNPLSSPTAHARLSTSRGSPAQEQAAHIDWRREE
jgi:hypothetical protein